MRRINSGLSFPKPMSRILLCLALVGLAGCASVPRTAGSASKASLAGEVLGSPIAAPSQEQYESKSNVRFEQPTPFLENASPVYPEQLLAARLSPVHLSVRVIVDPEGRVASVAPIDVVPLEQAPFLASVQAALLTWKFLPLVQITDGPGTSEIASGNFTTQYHGQAKTLAFHQDYAFVFRQQDGKGTVSAEKAATP